VIYLKNTWIVQYWQQKGGQREISMYPLLQLSTAIQVHKTGIILVFSALFGLNGLMNIPALALISPNVDTGWISPEK
jgi:hypothetical protein